MRAYIQVAYEKLLAETQNALDADLNGDELQRVATAYGDAYRAICEGRQLISKVIHDSIDRKAETNGSI